MNKKYIVIITLSVIVALSIGYYVGNATDSVTLEKQVSTHVPSESTQTETQEIYPVLESVWTPSPEIDPDAQSSGIENSTESIQENNNNKGLPLSQNQQVLYEEYTNDRFGFAIQYPSTFMTKLLPDNGDGIILESPDKSAELTVSGINNVLNETPESTYNDLLKEHSNASYKMQEDDWMVVSWIEGDNIVYEKKVVGSGSSNTIIIKYPSNQKEYYSAIIAHLNSTFKTPLVGDCH